MISDRGLLRELHLLNSYRGVNRFRERVSQTEVAQRTLPADTRQCAEVAAHETTAGSMHASQQHSANL